MKTFYKSLSSIIFLIIVIQNLEAQIHDFDSLIKNDEAFKTFFNTTPDSKDLFVSDDILNITIESDFKNLVKRKAKEEYQPANFLLNVNDTVLLKRNMKIKPRGIFRKSACLYPPLKLNFPKSEAVLEQLQEFDKMKMVMDCKKGDMYEQYLLSEYMAYKLQNILTDYCYRVRLLRVTYVDTSEKYKTKTQYAFIIEHKKQMAERLNAIFIEPKNVKDILTDLPTLANAYLFQYLIGNTDWSIPGNHNIHFLKSNEPELLKPYVVPYDFDFAGIVSANYAITNEELGISTVRERLYRGVCIPESSVLDAVKIYIEKKDEIYALYQNSDLLDKNNKRSSIIYLDQFYDILEDENKLRSNIIDSCRR